MSDRFRHYWLHHRLNTTGKNKQPCWSTSKTVPLRHWTRHLVYTCWTKPLSSSNKCDGCWKVGMLLGLVPRMGGFSTGFSRASIGFTSGAARRLKMNRPLAQVVNHTLAFHICLLWSRIASHLYVVFTRIHHPTDMLLQWRIICMTSFLFSGTLKPNYNVNLHPQKTVWGVFDHLWIDRSVGFDHRVEARESLSSFLFLFQQRTLGSHSGSVGKRRGRQRMWQNF